MTETLNKIFTWPKKKPKFYGNNHNWFGIENSRVLNDAIDDIKPKYILEIGSWTGAGSTKYILEKAPEAQVVCVDHWSKDLNDYVQEEFNIDQVRELEAQILTLWEVFLVNMWEFRDRVTPCRGKSVECLKRLKKYNIPFDLIYIDANHDYQGAFQDISISHQNWPNALIIGDDYYWEGVKRAVHQFADENDYKVESVNNCWYLIK